jgi:hypothetical protein
LLLAVLRARHASTRRHWILSDAVGGALVYDDALLLVLLLMMMMLMMMVNDAAGKPKRR